MKNLLLLLVILCAIFLFSCSHSADENFVGTWLYQPSISPEGYSPPDKDISMQGQTVTIRKCENSNETYLLEFFGSEILLSKVNNTTLKSINEKFGEKGQTSAIYNIQDKRLILNEGGYHNEFIKLK